MEKIIRCNFCSTNRIEEKDKRRLENLESEFCDECKIWVECEKVLDFVPNFKTKRQFEIFIGLRKGDIIVLEKAIKSAKTKMKLLG